MSKQPPNPIQIDTSQTDPEPTIKTGVVRLNNVSFYNETALRYSTGVWSNGVVDISNKELIQTEDGGYLLGAISNPAFSQYYKVNTWGEENEELRGLNTEWLNSHPKNNTYFMLYQGDTQIIYLNPGESALHMTGGTSTGNSTMDQIITENFDPFWTAVSFVRDYLIMAYDAVKKIENINDPYDSGVSIGNAVYLVLDYEVSPLAMNGWWLSNFSNNNKATEYVNKIAELISNIRLILTDTIGAFSLNGFGASIENITWYLTIGSGLPWNSKDVLQVANYYKTIIEALPAKYRYPKIGVYGIPDTYCIDVVPDQNGQNTGGWYGEDVAGDKQSRIWNYLKKQSIDILNNVIVDKYKVILDAVDFITPQVYAFEPSTHPAGCNGVGTNTSYDLYKLNTQGRNLYQQYTYDNVRRAVLYNKKYNQNKPILPMISPIFFGGEDTYSSYCKYAIKAKDSDYTDSNFVHRRFVDSETYKETAKYCYEAVNDVGTNCITGFLVWNSAASSIYYGNGYTNPFMRGRREYNLKRRVATYDVDSSRNPTNDSQWSDNDFDAIKAAWIRKSFSVLKEFRESNIRLGTDSSTDA